MNWFERQDRNVWIVEYHNRKFSTKEIGQMFGLSPGYVRNIIDRQKRHEEYKQQKQQKFLRQESQILLGGCLDALLLLAKDK